MKRIFFSIGLLTSAFVSYSQQTVQIGMQMPNHQFAETINAPIDNLSIADYRGKLLILDVWNKGCSSCVRLFPHMQEMQDKFGDKLQIVLVNTKTRLSKDSKDNIVKVLDKVRERIGKPITLPMVLNDENLDAFIPTTGVPYEVWIGPDGKVIGLTQAEDVNEQNIQRVLNGEKIKFIHVQYLAWTGHGSPDRHLLPLVFKDGSIIDGDSAVQFQCSIYQGRVGNYVNMLKTDTMGNGYGETWTYASLLSLYAKGYPEYFSNGPYLEVKVKDPFLADQLSYVRNEDDPQEEKDRHNFAYDVFSARPITGDKVNAMLKDAAERSFGKLYFEKTTVSKKILVATVNKKISALATKGGEPKNTLDDDRAVSRRLQNLPLQDLINYIGMTQYGGEIIDIIDSTNTKMKVDFTLPKDFDTSDKTKLLAFWKSKGIEFHEIEKEMPGLVITDEKVSK